MKFHRIIITIIFLMIIFYPLGIHILGIQYTFENTENRTLQEKPKFSTETIYKSQSTKQYLTNFISEALSYKSKFGVFFVDQFPFKMEIFKLFSAIKSGIFHTNPLPGQVIEGYNGWMFIGDDYSDVVLESKGIKQFTELELKQIKNNIQERKKWLDIQNIAYYVVIAPNKSSVYGEYLPIKQSNNKTKREQISELLKETKINSVDVFACLSKNKNQIVYHKTDSHWNDLGAFYAYETLINQLKIDFPVLKTPTLDDYVIESKQINQQDLSKILHIKRKENILLLHNKTKTGVMIEPSLPIPSHYKGNPISYESRYKNPVNNLKLLMFRDSFGTNWKEFIKDSFGESIFIWHYIFDKSIIELEKPDLIIHEIVERDIDILLQK